MKKVALSLAMMGSIALAGYNSIAHAGGYTPEPIKYGHHEGAVTLTPMVGHYFFATKRQVNNRTMLGIALGYDFTNNWGGELYVGRLQSSTKDSLHKGVNTTLYSANALYHFNPGKVFEPYLMAGVGALDMRPNGTITTNNPDGDDPAVQGNISAGGGLEVFAASRIGFRAEVRDIYTISGGRNDFLANAGVDILFG